MIYWEKPSKNCVSCVGGVIDSVELVKYHDGTCDICVNIKKNKEKTSYTFFQSPLLAKDRRDLKQVISAYLTDLCDHVVMSGEIVKSFTKANELLKGQPVIVFKDEGDSTEEITSNSRMSFSRQKFAKHHPEFFTKKGNETNNKGTNKNEVFNRPEF